MDLCRLLIYNTINDINPILSVSIKKKQNIFNIKQRIKEIKKDEDDLRRYKVV